jgi:hypothetical protein
LAIFGMMLAIGPFFAARKGFAQVKFWPQII